MNGSRDKITKKEFVNFLMNYYDGLIHSADVRLLPMVNMRLGQAFMITFDDVNYTGTKLDNIDIETDHALFSEGDEIVCIAIIVSKYLE